MKAGFADRWSILVLILLGTFILVAAGRAGTLSGSLVMLPAGSIADLTAQGPLDWVHYATYTEYGWDRKAGVTPRIGPLVPIIDPNGAGPYRFADNLTGFSWTDGSPNAIATNTTTGIWAISRNSGFQLTVPSDTVLRRLKVYVGAFEAQAQISASLSDNSAPPYTDASIDIGTNGPGGVYTFNFAANSTGQTFTVTYLVKRPHDNKVGNVTFQAAALANAASNNPPSTTLINPINNAIFPAGCNIPLGAIASDSDGTVTNVEFFQGITSLGTITNAPYSLQWSNVAVGEYVLRTVATDDGGLSYTSAPVEIFVNTNGGFLSGLAAAAPASLDLTASGPADWAHWGLGSSAGFDHKLGVAQLIPNATIVGAGPLLQILDYPTAFVWSDGMPTPAASTTTAVSIAGLTNGFVLQLPAMTYTQTLTLSVGVYASQGNLQAFLSDSSAPAFADSSLQSFYNTAYGSYTLGFASASPNQTLTVRYTSSAQYDMTYGGNVSLAAATLLAMIPPPPPPAQPPILVNSSMQASCTFTFCFATESNHFYTVEWSGSLSPAFWQTLTNFSGSGTVASVSDPSACSLDVRFYRVRAQ